MNFPCRHLVWTALLFLPSAALAQPVPLAVKDGRCRFVVETEHADDRFFLIVGSLAGYDCTARVTVSTEATRDSVDLPLAKTAPSPVWQELVREQARRQERNRRQHGEPGFPPSAAPAKSRTFHVFVKERDLDNPSHYRAVTGELRAIGRHCQVYVDRDETESLDATIAEVVRTFDDEVFPWSEKHLGRAHDTDRDGRFTILLSPLLGKLQGGKTSVDGFVRGSDFARDVAAPFSNRCDMMYLNSRVNPGPHLRTLLAHEYTHAVIYCEHVLETYLPVAERQDEESWLNEGMAHLVEDQFGYSWSNLDYRIGAYLSAPERYPLVVPEYFHAGLWRTPGTRGACYLFLRWCRERHAGLLRSLVQSNLNGVANLEAATQEPFAELFRRWALAQLHTPFARGSARFERLCIGPRFHEIALADDRREFALAGTGLLYTQLHTPGAARTCVTVQADTNVPLQVTLVRLPRQPRLSVRCTAAQPGLVTLHVTAHDGDVQLKAAAWERLHPVGKTAADTNYTPDAADKIVASWFGTGLVRAGQTLTSAAIRLPAGLSIEEVIFKLQGTDSAGHPLPAWAVVRRDAMAP